MDLSVLLEYMKQNNADIDTAVIEQAYHFAARAHEGQYRISGEEYINHPLKTAYILAELGLDVTTIVASLLHDVVEDTSVTLDEIEKIFGEEIALLVDGVTKLSRIEFKSKEDAQAEYLRKMFLAMAKDIRVILIKLADRLHNMRTLKHQNPQKQREIAQETLDIYAPLAHRLGIFRFKWELEDLSLRYLEPSVYYELVSRLKTKRKEREQYVQSLIDQIRAGIDRLGIEADIAGRPKNLYSIYNKMLKQGKDLDEIYDKIAIRVIVNSVRECYAILGVIHTQWKPLPGRFKDYIATPKPNMYQSLHTTLIGLGRAFEVQIKTWEMHQTAEYGIAAHWRYKEGSRGDKDFDEKLAWLRRTLEWQQDVKDTREFMESLKIDLFSATVFVFTPKGDVIELPADSCPVDFAYRVHTEVGHRCIGAKVNGRIVPLEYRLKNGDIVEILTSKQSNGPSRDWLNFVKTSQAKSRIKSWFKKEQRQENIIKGRDSLELELKRNNLDTREFLKEERLAEIASKFSFNRAEDLYAAIGDGVVTANQVIGKLKEEYFPEKKLDDLLVSPTVKSSGQLHRDKPSTAVRVKGVEDVMARLSHCCNPLPGDEIIGYITRGKGVSVHRVDCPNIKAHARTEADRIVEVDWISANPTVYMVEIEVTAIDRARLTADVVTIIADAHITLHSVFSRATRNSMATINLKLQIKDLDHLQAIMQRISKVKDVVEVRRVVPTTHH